MGNGSTLLNQKSSMNQIPTHPDQVKAKSFTDHDKRRVMEEFLKNDEIQRFLFGVLFPNAQKN